MLTRQTTEALVWKWPFSPSTVAVACARLVCLLRCTPRCVPLIVGLRRQQWWLYTAGFAGGTASRVVAWTRMLTCSLWCSTDARYRRAENCGAPQLQFVDQVERSLFDKRQVRTVQLCSRQLPRVVSPGQLRGSFLGPAHRCRAEGGHVHRDIDASVMTYRQRHVINCTVRTTPTTTTTTTTTNLLTQRQRSSALVAGATAVARLWRSLCHAAMSSRLPAQRLV